jgi:hypothetical protein
VRTQRAILWPTDQVKRLEIFSFLCAVPAHGQLWRRYRRCIGPFRRNTRSRLYASAVIYAGVALASDIILMVALMVFRARYEICTGSLDAEAYPRLRSSAGTIPLSVRGQKGATEITLDSLCGRSSPSLPSGIRTCFTTPNPALYHIRHL